MDRNYDLRGWKPSVGADLALNWPVPNPKKLERLKMKLQLATEYVRALPYDPAGWRERALVFAEFGFPELAAGDSYKAILLFDAAIDKEGSHGKEARSQVGRAAWEKGWDKTPWEEVTDERKKSFIAEYLVKERLNTYHTLLDALRTLMDDYDIRLICGQALRRYPKNPYIVAALTAVDVKFSQKYKSDPDPQKSIIEDAGRKISVCYPWSSEQFFTRSQQLIDLANDEMDLASMGALEIRQSKVAGSDEEGCLGVFAKRDIRARELIFNSLGPVNVRSDQMSGKTCYNCFATLGTLYFPLSCCPDVMFCTMDCQIMAKDSYHQSLCCLDFDHLYIEAAEAPYSGVAADEAPPFASLMWLRVLACCVQEDDKHPLESKVFERLAPAYGGDEGVRWTLVGKVITPIQILQGLGEDVFKNARWDQWVLEEMWNRLDNNYLNDSSTFQAHLGPLYSFFNHSCSPTPMLAKPLVFPSLARRESFLSPRLTSRTNPLGDVSTNEQIPKIIPFLPPPQRKPLLPYQPKMSSPLKPTVLQEAIGTPGTTGARKMFSAGRSISKDEEIFVGYADFFGERANLGKEERQKELRKWFGGKECGCSRCESEG